MDSNSVSNFISTGRSTASYVNKMQFSWTTWQHQLQFESWVTTVNLKVSYSFVKKIMAWQVQMKLGISHSQCHPTMNLYIQPLTHNQKISVVQENQLIFCWLTNTIFKQASQTYLQEADKNGHFWKPHCDCSNDFGVNPNNLILWTADIK